MHGVCVCVCIHICAYACGSLCETVYESSYNLRETYVYGQIIRLATTPQNTEHSNTTRFVLSQDWLENYITVSNRGQQSNAKGNLQTPQYIQLYCRSFLTNCIAFRPEWSSSYEQSFIFQLNSPLFIGYGSIFLYSVFSSTSLTVEQIRNVFLYIYIINVNTVHQQKTRVNHLAEDYR